MGKDGTFPNPKRGYYEPMMSWPTILVLVTIGLFMLPLIPAIMELYMPTDITPLKVVQAYDNNPMHFANGFRNYVHKQFAVTSISELQELTLAKGQLEDGTQYKILQEPDNGSSDQEMEKEQVLISHHPIILQADKVYEAEIYSASNISTGKNSRFRALLSDNTLTLNENCVVLRWVHSENDMMVGENSILLGRATSKNTITLSKGCFFERLNARKIITVEELPSKTIDTSIERTFLEALKDVKIQAGRRSLLEGNLDFPAYHTFDGDIVAGTTAIIGDYAHIKGSVKSNAMNDITYYLQKTGVVPNKEKNIARCELGHFVRIDGSLVSTHDLYIGENCWIGGPVIAVNLLVIRSGTVIGTPEQPCTVTAANIIIESGCVIYGTLWAGKQGQVTGPQHNVEGLAA